MWCTAVRTILHEVRNGFTAGVALMELEAGLGEVKVAVRTLVFVAFQLPVTRRTILEDVPFDVLITVPGDDDTKHEDANEDQNEEASPTEKPPERALLVRDGVIEHRRTCIGAGKDR